MSMFRVAVIIGSLSSAGLLALFIFTNPATIPSPVLLVVFGLLYGVVFSALLIAGVGMRRLKLIAASNRTIRRVSLALAGLVVFMLVLRSIGQLTVRDLAISSIFAVLLYMYYVRLRSTSTDIE